MTLFDQVVEAAECQGWEVQHADTYWEFRALPGGTRRAKHTFHGDPANEREVKNRLLWPLQRDGLVFPLPPPESGDSDWEDD